MVTKQFETIDEYISSQPLEIQNKLNILRNIIKEVAKEAIEKISYGMPTFYYYGNLVHFAPAKNHIGFYPGDSGVRFFNELTDDYYTSKGTIRINLNEEFPVDLIRKVVQFRMHENKKLYNEKNKS